MIIDFANAIWLIKGETYIITIPELPKEQLAEVRFALESISEQSQARIIVMVGEEISVSRLPLGMVN